MYYSLCNYTIKFKLIYVLQFTETIGERNVEYTHYINTFLNFEEPI